MESEKSQQEKAVAALSVASLVVAISLILIDTTGTIDTKVHFESMLRELMTPDKLQAITKFFVFTPTLNLVIFYVLLVLILILKELFIRSKKITVTVNIIAAISAIAYIPIYIIAIYLPIFEASAKWRNN